MVANEEKKRKGREYDIRRYQEDKNDLEKRRINKKIAIEEIGAKSEVERTDGERSILVAHEEKTNKQKGYEKMVPGEEE